VARPPRAVLALGAKPLHAGAAKALDQQRRVSGQSRPPPGRCWCPTRCPRPTCATAGSAQATATACAMRRCLGCSQWQCCRCHPQAARRGRIFSPNSRHSGRLGGHRPRPLSAARAVLRPTMGQPWRPLRGRPLYLTVGSRLVRTLPFCRAPATRTQAAFPLGHFSGLVDELRHHRLGWAGLWWSSTPARPPCGNSAFWRSKWSQPAALARSPRLSKQ